MKHHRTRMDLVADAFFTLLAVALALLLWLRPEWVFAALDSIFGLEWLSAKPGG